MKVKFVAKVVDGRRNVAGAYALDLDLPFTPVLGMKLKGGADTWLWETEGGNELEPEVKEIVYNVDEKKLYCLFEINEALKCSRWTKVEDLQDSCELNQFETRQKDEDSEEDSEALMREVLAKFISDKNYISKIEKTCDRQQVLTIKKAIAKCIDRKYTTNYQYLNTVNGDIVFVHFGIESSELTSTGESFLAGA